MKAQPEIKTKIDKEVFNQDKQDKYADWKLSIVDKSALKQHRKMWQTFDMRSQVKSSEGPGNTEIKPGNSVSLVELEPSFVNLKDVLDNQEAYFVTTEETRALTPEISKLPGVFSIQDNVADVDELNTLIKSKEESEMEKPHFLINSFFALFLGSIWFLNLPKQFDIETLNGIKEILDFILLNISFFIIVFCIYYGALKNPKTEDSKVAKKLWLDVDTIGVPGEKSYK